MSTDIYAIPTEQRNVMYASPQALRNLFSEENIEYVSKRCTECLQGVHPEGLKIIIAKPVIINVLDQVFTYYQQATVEPMLEQAIYVIVNDTKNFYETIEQNNKLNIWVTKQGGLEENAWGLASVPNVKIKQRDYYRGSGNGFLRY